MKGILIVIVMCTGHLACAQTHNDLLGVKEHKAYDIQVKSTSADGEWASILKVYDDNTDSLVIVNRKNPTLQYYRTKVSDHQWSKDQLILKYRDRTEVFDYTHNRTVLLPGCQTFEIMEKDNLLALYQADRMTLYDLQKKRIIDTLSGVEKIFYREGQLYYQVMKDQKYSLLQWDKIQTKMLYVSNQQAYNLLVLKNKALLIFEREKYSQDIVYFDGSTNQAYRFSEVRSGNFSSIAAYQRSDGTIMVNIEKIKDSTPADAPEIWNTTDHHLISQFKKSVAEKYLWSPREHRLLRLDTKEKDRVVDINNPAYLLVFGSELQDYTRRKAPAEVYRYDLTSGSYDDIDTIHSNVNYSPDGNYLVYKRGKNWKLVDVNSLHISDIADAGFSNSYFTATNRIYFDGSEGIWEYDIKDRKLSKKFNTEKGSYKILDFTYNSNFANYPFELSFYCRMLDENHYRFEIRDEQNFTRSLFEKKGSKYHILIERTPSRLVHQKTDHSETAYLFTEENYNLPKQLIDVSRSSDKKVIYRSNRSDNAQFKIKVETTSYQNAQGVLLSGILYYPMDFENSKTYPMVVHVYQIQSDKINQYPLFMERDTDTGFSIRALIEQGYFVYMPDIVFDRRGTGVSALDCVNRSIDALAGNPMINFEKLALTGHSHGGYITNFIATRSDRFATYVSGAGNSDIIRSYYSMNEEFRSPFYWQFENGQYEMNTPFVQQKDLYFNNNPIHYVEQVAVPVLLWTGKKDKNIEWGQVMEFFTGLKRNKKQATLLAYPEEGHTFSSKGAARDLHQKVLQWLGYYLKGERKPDWIN